MYTTLGLSNNSVKDMDTVRPVSSVRLRWVSPYRKQKKWLYRQKPIRQTSLQNGHLEMAQALLYFIPFDRSRQVPLQNGQFVLVRASDKELTVEQLADQLWVSVLKVFLYGPIISRTKKIKWKQRRCLSPTCKLGCCWRKIQYVSNLYNEYSLQVKSLKNENNYYIQKEDTVFSCMLKTEKRDLGKGDLNRENRELKELNDTHRFFGHRDSSF